MHTGVCPYPACAASTAGGGPYPSIHVTIAMFKVVLPEIPSPPRRRCWARV